jgi:Fe-Mn family superoxide dismutase
MFERMSASNYPGMSRRAALKTLGAGVVLAGLAGVAGRAGASEKARMHASGAVGWDLPKLPYAYDALEPHVDARTMEIHHTKHHQAYIDNAVKALDANPMLRGKGPEELVRNLASVPESARTTIRNNAGGHVNHAFFWKVIGPRGGGQPGGRVAEAIRGEFGSFDDFKKQFADAAGKRFGSGWAWLSVKGGKLVVHSTANQDSPLMEGMTPVLGLDVWEHAYYLHYQNRRADYVSAFWNIVNWTQVDSYYAAALRG